MLIDKMRAETIEQEWRGGVLLNPFEIIDKAISTAKNSTAKSKPKRALPICEEMAELFLECTDYLVIYQEDDVRNVEKNFITAMFLYLYTEAPANEMSLCMVCELVIADDPCGSEYCQSDLDRLFQLLAEKDYDHPALLQYKKYQKSGSLRRNALKSVRRRFRPLISITSNDENNIFDECSKVELFELAVALIHNCSDFPEEPQKVYGMVDETIFVTVALAYMMAEIAEQEQNSKKLFEILGQPGVYYAKITSALKTASPDAFPGLQDIFNYWYEHSEKAVAAGNYKKSRVNGAAKFFREFK